MFLVKTKLSNSKIHGIGVFAAEKIKKGAVVYKHTRELDLILTEKEFSDLDPKEQATIKHYGYIDKHSGRYRMDHDDMRFVNHSSNPNLGKSNLNGWIIALHDIRSGQELTQSYTDL